MNRAALIDKEVQLCAEAHPELASRLARARLLVDNVVAWCPAPKENGALYLVEGSQGSTYIVHMGRAGDSSCTCPDAGEAWVSHCKHQLAVHLRLKVGDPPPLGPRAFEEEARRWIEHPDNAPYWLWNNGLFAVRMLLGEIDRLRKLASKS
jgi:hypothetical protein